MKLYIAAILGCFLWMKGNAQYTLQACKQCLVIAEQASQSIQVVDVPTKNIIWQWKADANNMQNGDEKLFSNPSEAKIVYNGEYLLTVASGGGAALIRIADKKVMFYAQPVGNTHSAEVLPGGYIVTASSTGNYLMLYKIDTTNVKAEKEIQKIELPFAHNVVWDRKQQVLWSAGMHDMYVYRFETKDSAHLVLQEKISLPGKEGHDLFPVWGERDLWFTNHDNIYRFSTKTKTLSPVKTPRSKGIKSVSNGPKGWPTAIIIPKEKWWTDEVLGIDGHSIILLPSTKIYKARWVLPNEFSYKKNDLFKL
ncbi:hypothetical protein LX64_04392 [Chitinophaga skermanii]|uniref:Uncharacterized protein n=1 Tax=Chitinophaga skermanii TaxID=331697 RepID=A0A327Q5Y9_9BACT|nr:DUF6528 family protein [Chitinophaga skermanii]RAI99839.1 hypothetical protein LX64_04392 [Chitinophaga skermanii]